MNAAATHVDILNMESSARSAVAMSVPQFGTATVGPTSSQERGDGPCSRGEIVAVESVNPQNSESTRP